MSAENVTTVRQTYEAFARGDIPAALAKLDPAVEWIESNAEGLPARGVYRGPDGVAQGVFASVPGSWTEFAVMPEQFLDAGDHVVATGRVRAQAKETGKKLDAPFAHVFTLRDGKIVYMVNYHDTALWLEALRP